MEVVKSEVYAAVKAAKFAFMAGQYRAYPDPWWRWLK